jgi:hypothetical protein
MLFNKPVLSNECKVLSAKGNNGLPLARLSLNTYGKGSFDLLIWSMYQSMLKILIQTYLETVEYILLRYIIYIAS